MGQKTKLLTETITPTLRIRRDLVETKKAARDRKCYFCNKFIRKGEQYINIPASHDIFTMTFSAHLNCIK